MFNFFTKVINIFKSNPKPQHLGRWKLKNNSDSKADYANMDSCGDILCGKPDYFKKKTINYDK